MQCRKRIGTCNCEACGRKARKSASSERLRWYYQELLGTCAQNTDDAAENLEREMRKAERSVWSMRERMATEQNASELVRRKA